MYFHFRSNGYVIFNNMRGGWVGGLHYILITSLVWFWHKELQEGIGLHMFTVVCIRLPKSVTECTSKLSFSVYLRGK